MRVGGKKLCPSCKSLKPLSDFYKLRRTVAGYCKACTKKNSKLRQYALREKEIGIAKALELRMRDKRIKEVRAADRATPGYKTCAHCHTRKFVSLFYKSGKDSYCKECRLAIDKVGTASTPSRRLGTLLSAARTRARTNKWAFDIDRMFLNHLWEHQEGRCFYTGDQMTYDGNRLSSAVSIERVDSSKGYEQDNVILVCRRLNEMKNNLAFSEFVNICQTISRRFGKEVSYESSFPVESIHPLRSGGYGRRSNWPTHQVTEEHASGELLEPSARNGGGNQQPSLGNHQGTEEGSETRAVSSERNNQPQERPTPCIG